MSVYLTCKHLQCHANPPQLANKSWLLTSNDLFKYCGSSIELGSKERFTLNVISGVDLKMTSASKTQNSHSRQQSVQINGLLGHFGKH